MTDRKMDPDFEGIVSELRSKQKQEEKRKIDEIKAEQRRLKELKEKSGRMADKLPSSLMYDMHGTMVELQELRKFPPLSRKCGSAWKNPLGAGKAKLVRTLQRKSGKSSQWETEFYSSVPKRPQRDRMAQTYQRIYDNIVPEEGVTIEEKGRNPKTRGGEVKKGETSEELDYFPGTATAYFSAKTNNRSF